MDIGCRWTRICCGTSDVRSSLSCPEEKALWLFAISAVRGITTSAAVKRSYKKESDYVMCILPGLALDTLPTPFDAAMRTAGVALLLGGGVSDSSSFRLAWS
ncbi:Hypothetical predicted protein [Prunus dulcis]|uniref:Uncharacterized protein n=1 Tax=Prunus dulcis TaxID=3755 RepID=A0A5E4FJU4_PRUDU|nr:hypothetical protein L3X38_000254 [Prunus dulcis]VVA28307.1 Hypothetical predicted protein [Prunus dulcis]